jgi:hypothetical protein
MEAQLGSPIFIENKGLLPWVNAVNIFNLCLFDVITSLVTLQHGVYSREK